MQGELPVLVTSSRTVYMFFSKFQFTQFFGFNRICFWMFPFAYQLQGDGSVLE